MWKCRSPLCLGVDRKSRINTRGPRAPVHKTVNFDVKNMPIIICYQIMNKKETKEKQKTQISNRMFAQQYPSSIYAWHIDITVLQKRGKRNAGPTIKLGHTLIMHVITDCAHGLRNSSARRTCRAAGFGVASRVRILNEVINIVGAFIRVHRRPCALWAKWEGQCFRQRVWFFSRSLPSESLKYI